MKGERRLKNFFILADAVNYIEDNLTNPLNQEEIAAACHASLSSVQKLFRYAFRYSLKEYVDKRRLTLAASDLARGEESVTAIAMKYQYNSPEVFTRAFKTLWGIPPSTFHNTWKFTGLCPKLEINNTEVIREMPGRRVDISELYETLREQSDKFVICFDIAQMEPINKISRAAGDLAIREALKRIDEAASEDMMLFRIGGDEFALVTGYEEKEAVEEIAERILQKNGAPFLYGDREIPLSLHAGAGRISTGTLRYHEFYSKLQNTIDRSKSKSEEQNRLTFIE